MPPNETDNRRPFSPRMAGDFKDLFEKLPPHAPEAEMALLGSLILFPEALDEIITLVPSASFFYAEAHGAIYDAIKDLYDTHRAGDLVLLTQHLRDNELLQQVGGIDYLVRLAGETPSATNAVYYAKLVRAKALLRFLIDACGQTVFDAMNAGNPAFESAVEVLDRAETRVFEIAGQVAEIPSEDLGNLLNQLMDALEANEGRAITGVATNYSDLDEMSSGLQPGELIILAARPSMGKTALALNLAEQIAFGGSPYAAHGPATPVGFFSMEMSRQAIAQRLLCARAGVDSHRFRTNRLRKEDFTSLMEAADSLSRAPLYIDDTPSLSVMMLRAKARRMVKKYGVKCLFIDYLQLMTAPGASNDGRQQEVSAISRGVKALARELNIPIVCLAQLNRGAEQREGHRPRMADLRESGSIEQDADVIMLLHREEYYHIHDQEWIDENPDKVGLAELIIAKQRNGPTGAVEMTWDNATTRFKNHARQIGSFGSDRRERDGGGGGGGGGGASGSRTQPRPGGPGAGLTPKVRSAGPSSGTTGPVGSIGFAPGSKSGPQADFRDGGGPAPFDDDDDETSGLPI